MRPEYRGFHAVAGGELQPAMAATGKMADKQLSERLFPASASKPIYKMPDYAYVHKELQRSGITLNLLWLEYCDQCRSAGEIPYQSSQFNKYYADYLAKANATMHLNHKPGEIMQVDWGR